MENILSSVRENEISGTAENDLKRALAYRCEDGIPDLIFPSYIVFYSWHYYCMMTGQGLLATLIGFLMILTVIALVWLTFTFQRKKYATAGVSIPKGLHPLIVLVVVVPLLTSLPVLRHFIMSHTLAQLGIWVSLWTVLGYAAKCPRYYAYTTWTVFCYWVTLYLYGRYDVILFKHSYLVFSILCSIVPMLVGVYTFLKFVRENITIKVDHLISYTTEGHSG